MYTHIGLVWWYIRSSTCVRPSKLVYCSAIDSHDNASKHKQLPFHTQIFNDDDIASIASLSSVSICNLFYYNTTSLGMCNYTESDKEGITHKSGVSKQSQGLPAYRSTESY